MSTASPWDALLLLSNRPSHAVDPQATKVATVLHAIEKHQPMTTTELRRLTGLNSSQIWGLMRWHLQARQVEHDGTYWRMVPGYVPPALLRAAELLRAHGWTVEGPSNG